jgi:ribosomal protein S18 acetylase RimI-like enzyme
MWFRRELNDKTEILGFLERDRLYAAYAIGDLEQGLFEACTWAGAEWDGRLGALALFYHGLDPPALFLMTAPSPRGEGWGGSGYSGEPALRAVLNGLPGPRTVYITCRPEHMDLAREFYDWEMVVPMWRMALPDGAFRPVDGPPCQRLTADDGAELAAFYAKAGAVAFGLSQVGRGVYYGLRIRGRLVAVAGTHLASCTYGVAAVGNVYTEPEHRGRGYATKVTGAVVAELLDSGIADVVLNVGRENRVAARIYERLGFQRYCAFLEGQAERR